MTTHVSATTVGRTMATPLATTGSDLLGWSALPLLGSASATTGPWLFVAERSLAWISRGSLADAQFLKVTADYSRTWPFGDGTLSGVVIDGDALAQGRDDAALERILAEAARVTWRRDDLLVVCGYRLLPRRLGAWSDYGRRSAQRWRDAAARLGLTAATGGRIGFDGSRLTDVTVGSNDGGEQSGSPHYADRLVLRVASSDQRSADVIESIVVEASRGCGARLRIERVAVRKIGKTAVFLSGADRRRYIMRIARSPIALARAKRNFETLESLHASSLPDSVRRPVPAAVFRGKHVGYAYFVETCLDGRCGPLPPRRRTADQWNMEAVRYISALHNETLRRVSMDQSAMERLVLQPLAHLTRACRSTGADRVFGRIAAECEAAFAGRVLPLVRTHGDFTESNCLFDPTGRLTAVVDWEVSMAQGLPLVDLLQLMPVRGETGSHPRWQRFDRWLELRHEPERVMSEPVMGRYMRSLDLPADIIPALVLMQWVTHVADRVEARREDDRWVRLRLWQPLETLRRTLYG